MSVLYLALTRQTGISKIKKVLFNMIKFLLVLCICVVQLSVNSANVARWWTNISAKSWTRIMTWTKMIFLHLNWSANFNPTLRFRLAICSCHKSKFWYLAELVGLNLHYECECGQTKNFKFSLSQFMLGSCLDTAWAKAVKPGEDINENDRLIFCCRHPIFRIYMQNWCTQSYRAGPATPSAKQ